jgi:hypothetical protein
MAAIAFTITEKTSSALQFQLMENGSAINLNGITVSLLLTDSLGTTYSANTAILDATNGKVTYTPAAGDLVAYNSPYFARWKLVDGLGHVKYAPSGLRDTWVITQE